MKEIFYVLYHEGKPLRIPRFRIKCVYDSEEKARRVINGVIKQRIKMDISKITIEKFVHL